MHNTQALLSALTERVGAVQPELSLKIVERLSRTLSPAHLVECLENDGILLQRVDEALAGLFSEEEQGEADYGDSRIFRDGPGHDLLGKVNAQSQPGTATEKVQPGGKLAEQKRKMVSQTQASGTAAVAKGVTCIKPPVQGAPEVLSFSAYPQAQRAWRSQQRYIAPSPPELLPAVSPMAAPLMQPSGMAPAPEGVWRRPGGGGGRTVWGLVEFLDELSLSEYTDKAAAWASKMGAAFLEEIVENSEDLADDLQFKPLERRRFLKQGPGICEALVQRREVLGKNPSCAPEAVPPQMARWLEGEERGPTASSKAVPNLEKGTLPGEAGEAPQQEVISAVPAPGVVPIPQLGSSSEHQTELNCEQSEENSSERKDENSQENSSERNCEKSEES